MAPRFESFIPAGRSGWAKFYSQSEVALLGAQINYNPNAGTAAKAFNQGQTLHKLRLTSAATLTGAGLSTKLPGHRTVRLALRANPKGPSVFRSFACGGN